MLYVHTKFHMLCYCVHCIFRIGFNGSSVPKDPEATETEPDDTPLAPKNPPEQEHGGSSNPRRSLTFSKGAAAPSEDMAEGKKKAEVSSVVNRNRKEQSTLLGSVTDASPPNPQPSPRRINLLNQKPTPHSQTSLAKYMVKQVPDENLAFWFMCSKMQQKKLMLIVFPDEVLNAMIPQD